MPQLDRTPQARFITRLAAVLPLPIMQPVLDRIVRRIAASHSEIFDRLGSYRYSTYVIDTEDLPFALVLSPDPDQPKLRAVKRKDLPPHDARITGTFLSLFKLIDTGEDGDALFFSRTLLISGDTEAVVRLRNALDDVDGSIAADAAGLFGLTGRFVLSRLRHSTAPSL